MSNQINSTLGDLVKAGGGIIHTGPFGSQLHAEDYVAQGIPCIMPANMRDNRVDLSNISFISDEDAQRLSKYLVKEGDIVYSRRGNVTLKALIRKNEAGYFCGTGCLLLRPGNLLDSDYLTYYLSTPKIQSWIISQAIGATMPNLNTGILSRIPFSGPEKSVQKKISSALRAIDDKLEINNRINAELEAMAKTLYDYWFVQFDFPDANGKPYKTSGGKMEYNTTLKREIPAGWAVNTLSQIANITMGQSPAGESYNEDGIGTLFFQGSTDFGWLFPTPRQYTTSPARMAKKGDILLSVRAPVGDMNIANADCCIGRGLAALNSKSSSDGFLFYVMKYFKQVFDRRNAEGTTFGSMTKDDLHSLQVVCPEPGLLKRYDDIVSEYNKMIFTRSLENQDLTKLRDWLLPLLMNGQITVK
ncbi:restriction endonuclease subunit S [Escherichia coli]|jgi:type I restriction enzyme S subunit|uniref:restriction endonuclease subunit S n=1 Tax=Enterobacterales TaxID=91347 RepID=UPI0007E8F3D8|nr:MULTISPECIES: restriction endonuclease subunit S [Enterobacteriaceae]MDR3931651.1 restriction endonuclease subunit S [Escherichia sp.]HBW3431405.1 restriction endonuclease subunit S [Klebsiella pneumoniae]EAC1710462.1 restriction endonuclease subunit S [Escherichia coli]EEU9175924.1 restriction endonuclease subunit S [Escherichia coli]EEU9182221.1 restriction endonuclease subunit S [Escherichia coli]